MSVIATFTASASGFRRLPSHVGHGASALILLKIFAHPGAVGFLPAALQVRQHAFEVLGRLVAANAVVIDELDRILGAVKDGVAQLLRQIFPRLR